MDINQCIDKLGLNANTYKLDKSDPPHRITEWTGSDPEPSNTVLETVWAEIEADIVATQYQRDRKAEYPPMEDYLDGIVKGDKKQVEQYISDCLAVKERFPKNDGGN